MFDKAFSLIELMVVIAIVAILSAVSVPAYKDYVTKAKLTSDVVYFLDGLAQRSQVQFETTGQFATNDDLGLPVADPPNYVFPYISYLGLNDNPPSSPGNCHNGQILAYVSNYDGDGMVDNTAPIAIISIMMVEVDGIMHKFCYYMESDDGFTSTTNREILNGCTRETNASNFAGAVSTYIQTACQ